jgi:cellobiose phosphorylase
LGPPDDAEQGGRIDGKLILFQYAFMRRDTLVNYLTSNLDASSFETERRAFLGENGYGTYAHPLALDSDELCSTEASCGDNIGALLHRLGTLNPGDERRLITQLGCIPPLDAGRKQIEAFRDGGRVDKAFSELGEFWDDYLSGLQIKSPDPAMDAMLNIHNPRQCYVTKTWSRYLSLYQMGYGNDRGIGFRDSCQDVMGVLASKPEEARELIASLLSVQKRDGSAMHQFNPLTMKGNAGDSAEYEDRPSYYSDDHLWAVLAVASYLKETGRMDFLSEPVPYYEKDKAGKPLETESVLGHLRRGIGFTAGNLGRHGLPLLGFADCNDTVNLPAGAESVFTACLYGRVLLEMEELAEFIGRKAEAGEYRSRYEAMKERFEASAWDGAWYIRYFTADGSPLGSEKNEAGKIYANAQSWAVISGFASRERGFEALESVHRLLNTKNGVKLSHPGYNGYDRERGGVTTYPPGAKENGGIFLHANPWVMIALAMSGNGERACSYYRQINPALKNEIIDEYFCEPYCYPQNILSTEHPLAGKAANSWLSGTASWMYQAATQYILGIRPAYGGLMIDPCIPGEWKEFSVKRRFRNARYTVTVKNSKGLSGGVRCLRVDGKPIAGNLAPPFSSGEHEIEAVLGG